MDEKATMYPPLPQQVPVSEQRGPVGPPTYDQTYPITMSVQTSDTPQHSTHQVHTVQPTVIMTGPLPPLGPHAANVTCPNCGQPGLTEVRYENSTKTHLMALLLCVFGLCCCAPIPYCVDSCRNANHYCKSCQQYLGTHSNN